MRLKSFFAPTVEAALAEGSRELGPEAMIVQSRKAPPEWQHMGEWEVVLADTEPRSAIRPAEPAKAPERALAREIGELRRQLDAMRQSIARSVSRGHAWLAAGAAEIYAALIESEVDPCLAGQVVESAVARAGDVHAGRGAIGRAAAEEILGRFRADARLGSPGAGNAMVALVGPPGAGKTTTLIKLAVTYGLSARRPPLLVSADNCRIAAADQMRTYAAILGVGFELVETTRALEQALHLHRSKDLVLIDTPGFSPADMDAAAELARFLSERQDIDTHLVLSASMKSADITRAVDRFEIFRPSKLLFTRLDETGPLGPVLSEAVRTSKPVSFLSAGQQIPEDLEPAEAGRILERILPGCGEDSRAAA